MTMELVFIHGRAQQGKDSAALKQEWVECLAKGLAANDPPLPAIEADRIRFPFYGDALDQMTKGTPPDEAAEVIMRGEPELDDSARRFMFEVFEEIRTTYEIPDDEVSAQAGVPVTERGPLNWPWIRGILQRLDKVPQLSAATIALATYDVFQYLTNGVIRRRIDRGILQAMTPGIESVVVGHSLGTVVAYTLLLREGTPRGWKVPLFVTVGSPLAVNAIRDRAPGVGEVGGNRTPSCATAWFNAMDPRDAVALHPLTVEHFRLNPAEPAIANKTDVDNPTSNRHGISGYLGDPVVAKRIYTALNSDGS
jgi:hypothetical protein